MYEMILGHVKRILDIIAVVNFLLAGLEMTLLATHKIVEYQGCTI